MRGTPARISPATYPIAATATAEAYDFESAAEPEGLAATPVRGRSDQQLLFKSQNLDPRVIPFESLTSPANRTAIQIRAEETSRPAPVRSGKVEGRRARSRKSASAEQHELEFDGREHFVSPPRSHVICDAPVATTWIRVQAGLCDGLLMACGCLFGVGLYAYVGGPFTADKHVIPFLIAAVLTVPLAYKLLWAAAGRDTPGTRMAGLELVDFDGKRPSKQRLFGRMFGSTLSLLAGGIGMLWALVDEDKLTWHDHISSTFPTFRID